MMIMLKKVDYLEALLVGFGGLTLGSLSMLVPVEKKDKYLVPFVGIFVTGFVFSLIYKQIETKIFGAALVGDFDRYIGGFGDISTGGTNEFNQLYINEELPEEMLIPARGLGLDYSDQ
tara:strand:+ start:591 stop:944 length:354 start_codon:yes stop_codon:yes gene_type:complete